ncbi:MAG TPA: cytochrome P450 [Polyangiaceae bacterium]|nr:cytochrome P450 [Polyangiaceae bacterium]
MTTTTTTRTPEAATAAPLPRRAPGPTDPYGILNVAKMTAEGTLAFLRRLTDEYGDVVQLKIFGRDYFLVNHPDDIEDVLVKQSAVMGRDEYVVVLERVLGQGLLTSSGELWRRQRKLMAQAFTPRRIRDYGETMARVTASALRYADGEIINIHVEMARITMEVVAAVLFGATLRPSDLAMVGESLEVLNTFFANSPEAMLKVPAWVPTPLNRKVAAAVARLDGLIYAILAARRAERAQHSREAPREAGESEKEDLLGVLLSAQDEGGATMSDRQLRDEAMTLFLAGHETTALALAYTFYLLSTHPAAEQRVREELDRVLGDRLPTAEDVKQLVFTERVLKESMRLYPPAWTTGRQAEADVVVGGYRVPKGSQLLLSQWIVHRDSRFFPDPEAFDPDRWLPERAKSLPKFAYFPFGGGPRVCIGNHFAMMEATLILAVVLKRYHLELLPGQPLGLKPSVTLRQQGPGLRMRARAVARP